MFWHAGFNLKSEADILSLSHDKLFAAGIHKHSLSPEIGTMVYSYDGIQTI